MTGEKKAFLLSSFDFQEKGTTLILFCIFLIELHWYLNLDIFVTDFSLSINCAQFKVSYFKLF